MSETPKFNLEIGTNDSEREDLHLDRLIENLLEKKGLKSMNKTFKKIMDYVDAKGINLSDIQWGKISNHMDKFIKITRKPKKKETE